MAFMQTEVTFDTFIQADTRNEGIVSLPARYFSVDDMVRDYKVDAENVETIQGWFARLSAPGYMDCTEWSGPYASEDEARQDIADTFGDDDEA